MKIALVHDSVLPPKTYGGIERIIVSLAEELATRGHDVVVHCRAGSTLRGARVLPADHDSRPADEWVEAGTEFIHSHQPLKLKPRLPFLITIHGNGQPGETYFANTNFVSESHARNHGSKVFVYNGVAPDHYPFASEKENYFVFLAKASWRVKNLKTTIAMANDLRVPLHVMGGSGQDSEFVKFHGLVGEAEKLPLLKKARALIYATNWEEPFGIALTEALACGTPVIASANGAMPEIVSPDVGVVCRTYEDLLAAPQKLSKVKAEACRARVEENFSVAKMTNGYLVLYARITKEGELDQSPRYAFDPSRIQFLFKPTVLNRLRFALLRKI